MRRLCLPKFLLIILAAAIIACASQPSHAETLDNKTIREIYATIENDAKDKSRTRQHMAERLADNYSLNLTQSIVISGLPPQRSTHTLNREETIANALKGYDSMSIENNKIDIFDIRYSKDKKIAYVRQTVTTTGTLVIPGSATANMPMARYRNTGKCQEALTLIDNKIKFLQTACDDQMSVGQ